MNVAIHSTLSKVISIPSPQYPDRQVGDEGLYRRRLAQGQGALTGTKTSAGSRGSLFSLSPVAFLSAVALPAGQAGLAKVEAKGDSF